MLKIDMTGWVMKEHGINNSRLTVLQENKEYQKTQKYKQTYWDCICECGNKLTVGGKELRRGTTLSCGCYFNDINSLDLTNQRFGRLSVICRAENSGIQTRWLCKCDCGNEIIVSTNHLTRGHTNSCGCLATENRSKDLTGKKFGKLKVLKRTCEKTAKNNFIIWLCECECGNLVKVSSRNLITGNVESCGCLKSKGESKIQFLLQNNNIVFEKQKTYPDCLSDKGGFLRFDFYINNEFLLEFDGKQHYEYSNSGWNNQENYLITKRNDEIKNCYCENKNIVLKRIPYWELESLTFEKIMDDTYVYHKKDWREED